MIRSLLAMVVVLAGLTLTACGGSGGYMLRGRVISGPIPAVASVAPDDRRLSSAAEGVSNATIAVTLDPKSLGRKLVGDGLTDLDGNFEIPIDEFGAGFLEYEIALIARAQGYITTERTLMMPASDRRVLIIVVPGKDRYQPTYSPREDLERFSK